MAVSLAVEQIAVEYNPLFSLSEKELKKVEDFVLNPQGKFFPDETFLGVEVKDDFVKKTVLEFINEKFGNPEILPKKYIEAYNLIEEARETLSYSHIEDLITSFVEGEKVDKEKLKLSLIRVFRIESEYRDISTYLLSVINKGEENGRNIFAEVGINLQVSPANTLSVLSQRIINKVSQLYSLLKYTNWEWYGKKCAPSLALMIFQEIDKRFPYLSLIEKRGFLDLWKNVIEKLETNNPLFFKRLEINLRYEKEYPYTLLFALSLFSRSEKLRKVATNALISAVREEIYALSPQREKFLKRMVEIVEEKQRKNKPKR